MTPQGHPARSDPGQIVGPRGRCANEENARIFHQGPDISSVVHREAGYIAAALFSLVHHVRRRCCSEGWVHI
jgi:hypothetical protein